MRILLTIQTLEGPAGGSLYIRDFALELFRQGHRPVVYCRRLGAVSTQLVEFGIPVADSLDRLEPPDIIHGNSPIETAAVILGFPCTPAIFVCHGWDSPDARAPRLPEIMRYLAVSDISRDRLVYWDGVPDRLITMHQNPVDLARFPRRGVLPPQPRRALVFSNTLTEANHLATIEEACSAAGIALDVIGQGMGKESSNPESVLGNYDLVFARGRCALEALATGCAVILCDALGLGELLTTENYEVYRPRNFGRRTLQLTFDVKSVLGQIGRYDSADAAALCDRVREREGLCAATAALVEIYYAAIEEFGRSYIRDCAAERRAAAKFLEAIAAESNTFYLAEHLQPLDRRARRAEARIRQLGETLGMKGALPSWELSRIRLRNPAASAVVDAGRKFQASVAVENRTRSVLSSLGERPMHLSYHWLGQDGGVVLLEGIRSELFPPLPPGVTHTYGLEVQAPETPGEYVLRLTLVQELVAWLDAFDRYADVPCRVV